MFKILILLIGLAIGFGVGVWWGVHHPSEAATLSAAEEQQFLEAQMKITQATKDKLDQLATKHSKTAGSSFLGGGGADPDIAALRDQQQKQYADLQKHLDEIKKK